MAKTKLDIAANDVPKSQDQKYFERGLRSIGIMSQDQLTKIRNTPVAIGGLGLGGSIFINLVRLGFEKFHVADPDVYERTNVNRQRMAKETTVGCRKDDCLLQEARAINPDIEVKTFRDGVSPENAADFLNGMGWVVDAVDVFAIPAKIALHEEAQRRGLPLVTCASVGFGAAIVVFDQTTPGFCEVSGLDARAPFEVNIQRFVKFITPRLPGYMQAQVEKALARTSHLPFVVPGVEVSAALVTTEICKHLLKLGDRVMAPNGIYFDPVEVKIEQFATDSFRRADRKPLKAV